MKYGCIKEKIPRLYAIVNFNPKIIKSKIKSDYILFKERENNEFNHMGIVLDKNKGSRYVETFFHEKSDKYIAGQTIAKVKMFRLYDANGKVIVEDSF